MKRTLFVARLGAALAVTALGAACGMSSAQPLTSPPASVQTAEPTTVPSPLPSVLVLPTPTALPVPTALPAPSPSSAVRPNSVPKATVAPTSGTCGGDYYRNVDGVCVHRPTAAPSAPAGASAVCGDGTYSFSLHRQGTCSHHGGVARWL